MKRTGATNRPTLKEKMVLPAIFLLVLLLLGLLGILPTIWKIEETQIAIEKLRVDLRRQETLLPIHSILERRIQDSLPEAIAVNQIRPLKIEAIDDLPEVFETLASVCKAELVSVTPQVRSLQGGREVFRVDTRMRGDFPVFNTLLNRLNQMVFVETIDFMAINVTPNGQEMDLSVWLAIK